MNERQPFDYSLLNVGDLVEVSTQLDFSEHIGGIVVNPHRDCADILFADGEQGLRILRFCWHIDDERTSLPGKFEESQELETGPNTAPMKGIFRLSKGQELLNALPDRLSRIEQRLAAIERQVDHLVTESRLQAMQPDEPQIDPVAAPKPRPVPIAPVTYPADQPRRRGRPRKLVPESPAEISKHLQAAFADRQV